MASDDTYVIPVSALTCTFVHRRWWPGRSDVTQS